MKLFRGKHGDLDERLRAARAEQSEVRAEGRKREPMIRRLENHARTNHFAERFEAAMRRKRHP